LELSLFCCCRFGKKEKKKKKETVILLAEEENDDLASACVLACTPSGPAVMGGEGQGGFHYRHS
jgi:hypothetical protein